MYFILVGLLLCSNMLITIPGELADLNAFIKATNNSRYGGNNIKQVETDRVAYTVKKYYPWPEEDYPVHIMFRWYTKNTRKDIDNVAFAKKFVLDGLVRGGIILDDRRKYVSGFTDTFCIDKDNPRVDVSIEKARF